MDPLSDVLSLLKLRSYVVGGFDAGGEWSIAFGRYDGIKCYAVVSGQCWLSVEGVPEAVRVRAGDCYLLPRGHPFCVASDLALTPIDARTFFPSPVNGGVVLLNGGEDFSSVGGHFALSGDHARMLLEMLPPIVHIQKEADKAALRWSMERMRQELREPQPGGFLVAEHLAHLMMVQVLRLHLAEGLKGGVGWLFALADRQMSAAINAMHEDTAHRWTAGTGGTHRHVAINLCSQVQRDGRRFAYGAFDALAHVAGRGQARELQRSHFCDRPIARL
jgi:hypothetical protein